MRILLTHIGLKTILISVVLLGYLAFRLLFFGIGPKKWTGWLRGKSGGIKASPAAPQ
jgi:hypothetical protein